MLGTLPSLSQLNALIARVPSYPITAGQLADLAVKEHAPQSVVDFYKSFHEDEAFSSQEDLLTRSEHIEIMNRAEQPVEVLLSAEED
jgi:hypothetical protein